MPKATSSGVGGGGREALRRNQACRQCRKRKLKCDAQKPHCSTCVKQWTAQIAVPPPVGFSHPPDPRCQYDNNDNLGLQPLSVENIDDPKKRAELLERQIEELQVKLDDAQKEAGITPAPPSLSSGLQVWQSNSRHSLPEPSVSPLPPYSVFPAPSNQKRMASPQSTGSRPATSSSGVRAGQPGRASPSMNAGNSTTRVFAGNVDIDVSQELNGQPAFADSGISDGGSYDLIFSGWNPDLPEPRLLHHMVNLYFSRDTCASRILHRPSFLFAMTLPPTHPDFPHPALLHAMCASASRWTVASAYARDTSKGDRDKFAEYHASKTRYYIDQTIASGQNVFSVLLSGIVLAWWYYHEGRWVDVWRFGGFLTRVSIPLGLNHPGTTPSMSNGSPYLAPPNNATDLEQRRRAWWLCIAFDRIVSVGGWPHSVDDKDIGTELPLRRIDFEADLGILSNPQDLSSEGLFVRHNPSYTDPFILFIKACMLFGRVTDYNTRSNLHGKSNTGSSSITAAAPAAPAGEIQYGVYRGDPRTSLTFRNLDRLVAVEFLANLPVGMKSCLGVQQSGTGNTGVMGDVDGSALDTDLYLVHLIPHAATITLHNNFINFSDPSCPSAGRCLEASKAILNAYLLISSTSFDIKRLHPFVTICWYLAAVVLVQLCKRLIEIGDRAGEGAVWGEINLLRMAMLNYGTASPIGVRQEKLLQGLMADIVRMTSQMQPLSVGVPLYPFSRTSLYDPTFQPTHEELSEQTSSSELQVSSLLTGRHPTERRTTISGTGGNAAPSPPKSPMLPPSTSAPAALSDPSNPMGASTSGGGMLDDFGIGDLSGLEFGAGMISAQGIWKPAQYDPMQHLGGATGAVSGSGSGTNIFEELGL